MPRLKRMVAAGVAACLTGAAAVVLTASASAETKVYTQRIVSKTVEVAPKTTASARALCATGEVNTGGGFTVTGATDPSAYDVFADMPLRDGWMAAIWLEEGYGPVDLTAFAVCVTTASGAVLSRQLVEAAGRASAQGLDSVEPTCPSGHVATGGGYFTSSQTTVTHTVYTSRPVGDNAWRVQFRGQYGEQFLGAVVCIEVPQDAPLELRTTTMSFAVTGQTTVTRSIRCDSGGEAISGGGWFVADTGPNSYVVLTNQPTYTRTIGHHWKLGVFSDRPADSPRLAVRAYAVCIKTTY